MERTQYRRWAAIHNAQQQYQRRISLKNIKGRRGHERDAKVERELVHSPGGHQSKHQHVGGGGRSSNQFSHPRGEVPLLCWSWSRHHMLGGNSAASPLVGG